MAPLTHNLSAGQRALWLLQRIEPDSPAYNVARAIRVNGPVHLDKMRRAWERIAERHAVLRSYVRIENGAPAVVVEADPTVDFESVDATDWDEGALHEALAAEVRRPFDLASERPLRIRTFSLAEDDHIGMMTMHHAVTDMWSLAILVYEFASFYQAELDGEIVATPFEPTPYADFVHRQDELVSGERGEELLEFWSDRLEGVPPLLELPTDRPRPERRSGHCSVFPWMLDPDLVDRASKLAKSLGSNLPTLLTSVFQALLGRYSGAEDFVIGSPQAGRTGRFAGTVGYFVNPVPLRADLSDDPPFSEFLRRNDGSVRSSRQADSFPFPLLVEHLKPERPAGRSPIFEICFSWQKTTRLLPLPGFLSLALHHEEETIPIGGGQCHSFPLTHQAGPFDLVLLMAQEGDHVKACFEYDPDLFEPSTVARMRDHYLCLLDSALEDPDRRLSDLRMMGTDEQAEVLAEWSTGPVRPPEAECLHQLFERRAAETPERTAVEGPSIAGGRLAFTYGELEERSNQVARHLGRIGVETGSRVAVYLQRSPEMIAAVLGTLKAGASFVPVDAGQPSGRLTHILSDAGVAAVLTQSSLAAAMPSPEDIPVVSLDLDGGTIEGESGVRVATEVGPRDVAYVIYTSGSTGPPKGVLVEHAGAVNLVQEQVRGFGVTEEDRVLQFASPSFDAAVSEIFMALARGSCLVLAGRESLLPGPPLLDLLRREAISIVTLPPSVLSLLQPEGLQTLRMVISAGEACSWDVARRWGAERRFFNAYGPTEATIGPTYFEVLDGVVSHEGLTVPIGRPLANVRTYVLDGNLRPVPAGVPGELCVGGVCVARGYLNQPALTEERFIEDPFGQSGDRIFRTGDRVRWLSDRTLEYLGRYDNQLKIRGFRVEPAEIEAALEKHPAVRKAAVVARSNGKDSQQLAAYVLLAEEAAPESGALGGMLREHVRSLVPPYMVPSAWMAVDELPRTTSGKIDRNALPPFRPEPTRTGVQLARPQSEIERVVASVWEEALGIDQIGVHENFFDLGGHSLLALSVHDRLEEQFGESFPMVEMFRYPTVAALADYLRRNGASRPRHRGRERGALQKRALEKVRARAKARSERDSATGGAEDV